MINSALSIAQFVTATLLATSILLQARGSGLGASFGGDGNVYRTKRGIEKRLFQASVVLSVLFFGIALANVLTA